MPIQIAMIARITAAYGLTVPSSKLAALVGSLMLSSGATTAGRWMVSSLLRFAPVVRSRPPSFPARSQHL